MQNNHDLGARGLEALALSEDLGKLKHLNLRGVNVDLASCLLLRDRLAEKGCEIVGLRNQVCSRYIQVILDTLEERHLTSLNLSGILPRDELCERIFLAPVFAHVQRLDVSSNKNFHAIKLLTQSAAILVSLSANNTMLEDEDLERFREAGKMARLEVLELRGTGIGARGLRALITSPAASRLRELDLMETELPQVSMQELATSRLTSLTRLFLPNITMETLCCLAKAPWIKQLDSFEVSPGLLDLDECRRLLATSQLPTQLERALWEHINPHTTARRTRSR